MFLHALLDCAFLASLQSLFVLLILVICLLSIHRAIAVLHVLPCVLAIFACVAINSAFVDSLVTDGYLTERDMDDAYEPCIPLSAQEKKQRRDERFEHQQQYAEDRLADLGYDVLASAGRAAATRGCGAQRRCASNTGCPSDLTAPVAMSKVSGPDLTKYMDKKLAVKLNANRNVTGILRGFDQFMNVVLEDCMEIVSASSQHALGMVVIRGNSIIMIESLEKL